MAIEFVKEVAERSGIYDRRFLIGLAFPVFINIIILHTIAYTTLPDDVQDWIYTILITFTIGILLNEYAPDMCWRISRSKKRYRHYLQKNFDPLFYKPVKETIAELKIKPKDYKDKFKEELSFFVDDAEDHYFSNYTNPNTRYGHLILQKKETRLLFSFIIIIFSIINLIASLAFIFIPDFNIWIFSRDQITSDLLRIILCTLFSGGIVIGFLMFLTQYKNFWEYSIQSTHAPYLEEEREKYDRKTIMDFYFNPQEQMFISSLPLDTQEVKNFLEKAYSNILLDEIKQIVAKTSLQRTFTDFFEINAEKLSIKVGYVPRLSKELSEVRFRTRKAIEFIDQQELRRLFDENKEQIIFSLESQDFESLIVQTGIVIQTSSLMETILAQTTGEQLITPQLRVLKGLNITSEEEFEKLHLFRQLRNSFAHRAYQKIEIQKEFIKEIIEILDKILTERWEILFGTEAVVEEAGTN